MKTPEFWNSSTPLSSLLVPLSSLYYSLSNLRQLAIKPVKPGAPVLCIGNVTAGGAGKTPVALAIGERLKARGINAFYLSRGYGGKLRGPVLVDSNVHSAADVGDEPLLLAEILPTVVSRDRVAGAAFAVAQGAQLIVMDDGLQNPSLIKTLALLVVDGTYGFGNGRLLPAGPLREPLRMGLGRAHAVVIVNPTSASPDFPPDTLKLTAKTQLQSTLTSKERLLAFCGIARPQKFFDMLNATPAQIVDCIAFADHHAYKPSEIEPLLARAAQEKAIPVTTAKDAVRLPKNLKRKIAVARIKLFFDKPEILDAMIDHMFVLYAQS